MQLKHLVLAAVSAAVAMAQGNCSCSPTNGDPCLQVKVGKGQTCVDACIAKGFQLCG